MKPKTWIAKGAVTTGPLDAVMRLIPIVEEHRVWLWCDDGGSWVSLHESPARLRTRPIDLWGTYQTREDALRAVWEAEQELRASSCDRRNTHRRRHSRPRSDRRAPAHSQVWTTID